MVGLLIGAGVRTRMSPGAVRRRRSGGQLKVQVGRSTTSRQTTTGTNALEVDMPPRHQRYAVGEDAGGGHVPNCATDTDICPNRGRFALTREQKSLWETGRVTVRTAPVTCPAWLPTPGRPFGIYIHVPFCATRCGYCDFNTYTPAELGGANPDGWLVARCAPSSRLAADLLGSPPGPSRRPSGSGSADRLRRWGYAVAAGRRRA